MLTINCKGQLISFEVPRVMGIINATPDSFYSESRHTIEKELLQTAEKMLNDGASFIDIGGQSTRPGSERIPVDVELKRVIPAIETIIKKFPQAIISIDTYYSKVAEYAVNAGAAIVNDVSAGSIDENLVPTVVKLKVPYILMHMQGDLQTMQKSPTYKNVVLEVFDALNFKLNALHKQGIKDVIIVPGFGFGKTTQHNFQLLAQLDFFQQLNKPLLIGLSRKGMIYKTLGTTADEALNGTTALNTFALMNGANILRVHDVKEAVEAVTLFTAVKKEM
jgi:dihydropteroate synthase